MVRVGAAGGLCAVVWVGMVISWGRTLDGHCLYKAARSQRWEWLLPASTAPPQPPCCAGHPTLLAPQCAMSSQHGGCSLLFLYIMLFFLQQPLHPKDSLHPLSSDLRSDLIL